MAISAKQRKIVTERDGGQCCACGANYLLEVNHRINRGMGGSPRNLKDYLANLILMCSFCNSGLEDKGRPAGIKYGWKLQSWDDPFRTAAFFPHFGEWRLFDNEGGFDVVDGRDFRSEVSE